MKKIKNNVDNYKQKITTISGYCGNNYEENLKRFKKELNKNGGYIDGIVTISSIVIYKEKIKNVVVDEVGDSNE